MTTDFATNAAGTNTLYQPPGAAFSTSPGSAWGAPYAGESTFFYEVALPTGAVFEEEAAAPNESIARSTVAARWPGATRISLVQSQPITPGFGIPPIGEPSPGDPVGPLPVEPVSTPQPAPPATPAEPGDAGIPGFLKDYLGTTEGGSRALFLAGLPTDLSPFQQRVAGSLFQPTFDRFLAETTRRALSGEAAPMDFQDFLAGNFDLQRELLRAGEPASSVVGPTRFVFNR